MTGPSPYPEASSGTVKSRRRKHLKAYNILGDADEYESMLRAVEKPRTPTPEPPAAFDVSNVPPEVMDAMQLDESLYQPILEVFHELVAERLALQDEYARVNASQAQTEECVQEQSHTRSADTRDSRTLAKHKEYEETWAIQAVHLASRLGKQPDDVALSRAFKFRKRREKLDHLHKSKPVHERLPGHLYWQVGNEFNGLYTEAKEKPSELLDVPLEIFGKPKALDPSRGATASLLIETLGLRRRRMLRTQEEKGRAWLQGSYLAETLQRYKKLMTKMMAHNPETDDLVVIGTSQADALRQRAEAPLHLRDVLARLGQTNPEASARYEEAAAVRKQLEVERATAALQEAEEALQLHQEATGPSGPAVRFSGVRIVMTTTVGTTASQTLTVQCVGTAAFRFYWTRTIQRPAVAAPDTFMHTTSEAVVQSAAAEPISEQSGFYMYSTTGSIMPGEERTFEFMWKPTQQNMATELWQMHTSPPCVPGFEPPQVVLRGEGVKHDSDSLLRKRVHQGLVAGASRREAAAALERVLRDLHVPHTRPERIPSTSVQDHDVFAAAAASGVIPTGESAAESRPLFWREGLGARVQDAYGRLKELITPVRQETPPGGALPFRNIPVSVP